MARVRYTDTAGEGVYEGTYDNEMLYPVLVFAGTLMNMASNIGTW
jgi:hypothetical protein